LEGQCRLPNMDGGGSRQGSRSAVSAATSFDQNVDRSEIKGSGRAVRDRINRGEQV